MVFEAGIGFALALIIFLAILGYNIAPFLVILLIIGAFYFILIQKGVVNYPRVNKYVVKSKICFDDIGGQNTAKQELKEALDFIVASEKAQNLGIRPLKGILLTGPPGTGKTLLAKAAASYTDAAMLVSAGSEFVEMYAGVGAKRVRSLFKKAKETALKENKNRAVIFIDEIEVLGGKRGSNTSHLEYDQTLNQLLVEMDGLKANNILVIAATNRVDMLDSALLRPGRFDRLVKVDLPDKAGRLQILKIHTRNKPLGQDVDLESIAQESFGFSGAHLESLANEAAIYALRDGNTTIENRHFREALDKVMLGEKLDKKPNADELARVAIHEAGHGIISELMRPGSVATITVIPRNQALGYVRQKPESDTCLYTKSFLEKQIKITLAGAVAEEIILGERSTGSANDFQEAVKLAKQIILNGLSPLGIIDPEQNDQIIRDMLQEILHEQENQVKDMLKKQKEILVKVAAELKKEEKVSGEQLRALMTEDMQCA
ncbi:AAA family ATPase [Bacillota bacterium LX-D]|nr:AAA family ATPase [Bacillota bacterium LX-D]